MIKANLRWFLLSVVVIFSISSFIYINTVELDIVSSDNVEVVDDLTQEQPAANLPDLEVVKRIIEGSKKIIHLF